MCFPVLSCKNSSSDTILLDVYARLLLLSLTLYFFLFRGKKEEDYHSTTSGHRTTRLPNRGKRRMTVATDPVAASLATVCLLPSSITTAAADSRRQRLVLLLSALWREFARELFRGVGFLGERAARDAIVLPASVPIADCVPAHTTASSLGDEDRRSARSQLVAWCRDEATRLPRSFCPRILSIDCCPPLLRASNTFGWNCETRHSSLATDDGGASMDKLIIALINS